MSNSVSSHFLGNARIEWPFENPNHLGAWLCILFPMLWHFAARQQQMWRAGSFFIVNTILAITLVLTYSRGAYLSLLAQSAFLLFYQSKKRPVIINLLILFIAFITVPDAEKRVSISSASRDKSVNNRLVLWTESSRLANNNWTKGVGISFGEIYSAWYQPLSIDESYRSAVNNSLTIYAFYGAFGIAIFSTMCSLPIVFFGNRKWRDDSFYMSLVVSHIGFFLTGCFTTTWDVPVIALTETAVLVMIFRTQTHFSVSRLTFLKLCGAICLFVCIATLPSLLSKNRAIVLKHSSGRNFTIVAMQNKVIEFGKVVFWIEQRRREKDTARLVLRPWISWCSYITYCGVDGGQTNLYGANGLRTPAFIFDSQDMSSIKLRNNVILVIYGQEGIQAVNFNRVEASTAFLVLPALEAFDPSVLDIISTLKCHRLTIICDNQEQRNEVQTRISRQQLMGTLSPRIKTAGCLPLDTVEGQQQLISICNAANSE